MGAERAEYRTSAHSDVLIVKQWCHNIVFLVSCCVQARMGAERAAYRTIAHSDVPLHSSDVTILRFLFLVVYKPMGAKRAAYRTIAHSDVPLHSSDVTISLHCVLCGFARTYRTLRFCEWNMCYVLMRAGYILARRKNKNEIRLVQGMRFLSILFNLVNIRGVVHHK